MIKTKVLLLVFIALVSSVFATKIEYKASPAKRTWKATIFGSAVMDNNLLALKQSKGGGFCIEIYDPKSLTLKSSNIVIDGKKTTATCISKKFDPEGLYKVGSKVYLLASAIEKKSDKYTLVAKEVDKNGKLKGKLLELSTIKIISKRKSGNFWIYTSDDESKLFVLGNLPYKKNENEKFSLKIFGEDLKSIKKMDFTMPYKDEDFGLDQALVTNDGQVFLFGEHFFKSKSKTKGQDESEYVMVGVDPHKEKTTDFKIKLPNKDIVTIGMSVSKDQNEIHCLGFYSDLKGKKSYGKDSDGIFNLTISTDTYEVIKTNTKKFDGDILSALKVSKKKKKKKKQKASKDGISNNYEFREILPLSDGSYWAFFEYYNVYEVCTTDSNGNTKCRTHYVYGSIIMCKVLPDGTIQQITHVHKNQHTVDDGGFRSSYTAVEKDDEVILLYNDHQENIASDISKSLPGTKKMALFAVKVKDDGSVQKEIMRHYKTDKGVFIPKHAVYLSKGELVAPFYGMPGGPCACFVLITKPKTGICSIKIK